jgi:hypothetical protein
MMVPETWLEWLIELMEEGDYEFVLDELKEMVGEE